MLALCSTLGDRHLVHNYVFYVDYCTAEIEMMDNPQIRDKTKSGVPLGIDRFYAAGQGRFRVLYLLPTLPDPNPGPNRLVRNNCYVRTWLGHGPNEAGPSGRVSDPLLTAPGRGGPIAQHRGRDFRGNPLPGRTAPWP